MADFTNVLTDSLDVDTCNKLLLQMDTLMYRSGPAAYAALTDKFMLALNAQLVRYEGRITFEPVPKEVYQNPHLYSKARYFTTLMTYEQTGAQLEKEVHSVILKLPMPPCVIGAVGTDFVGGRLIFIVLYIKRLFPLVA